MIALRCSAASPYLFLSLLSIEMTEFGSRRPSLFITVFISFSWFLAEGRQYRETKRSELFSCFISIPAMWFSNSSGNRSGILFNRFLLIRYALKACSWLFRLWGHVVGCWGRKCFVGSVELSVWFLNQRNIYSFFIYGSFEYWWCSEALKRVIWIHFSVVGCWIRLFIAFIVFIIRILR